MRANCVSAPGLETARRRIAASWRAPFLALMALCAGAVWAGVAPTVATAAKAPEYSLAITEGASTQPELFPVAMTSGRVSPPAEVVVSIIRNGIVVTQHTDSNGGVYMSDVPNVGDVVTLESPLHNLVGSVVYDGLPSMDSTVCAGSESFSGQRSMGQEVEGGYYSLMLYTDPYGNTSVHQTGSGHAQVTSLSGSAYAGNFLAPLQFGQTVWVSESLRTSLAGGAVFSYSSENERPVGACPVPPPPPPPPPLPPALQGVLKLTRTTIHKLLKSGWLDQVTINQPGTVVQDLYLQDGKLPAFASSNKGRRHPRKIVPLAQLVARGSTTAKSAGTVNVLIRLTAKGRHLLRHRSRVQLALVTTLRSNTGAKLSLARRSVTLHR
jgi:hypothetical protein